VPANLQKCIIEWYHSNLRHPGVTQTLNSICQSFYWKGIHGQVEDHVKTCEECQRHKIIGKPNYGILPLVPALCNKNPFEKIQVDCAGPWTVCIKDGPMTAEIKYEIHILTMVDAFTNWMQLAIIPTTTSRVIATQFNINWLCCYP
jgi:hypothetical protein